MIHNILWTSSIELHKDCHREHWRVEIYSEPNVHADFGLSDGKLDAPPGRELMISMAVILLKAIALVVEALLGFFFDHPINLAESSV